MESKNIVSNSVTFSSAITPKPAKEFLAKIPASPLSGKDADEKIAKLRREKVDRATIFIGAGTCGLGAGAGKTLEVAREFVKKNKLEADVVEVGCIGLCSEEPIMDVQLPGKTRISFAKVTHDKAENILGSVFKDKLPEAEVVGQFRGFGLKVWDGVGYIDEHPFMAAQRRVVLVNSGIVNPSDIDEYIARGGYMSLFNILSNVKPEEVCNQILKSGLRGRGGGGFLTGKKWLFARASKETQKYLICNADEGDPGAFMDRAVCESDPHRLIEGMIIAAYGIGASKAYVYIRAEYPLGIDKLTEAIAKAKSYGLLGKNILGSGFDLEIAIKKGAGAFVCGEETALIHSIEGKRGMPRPRPPFPAARGLFGKPTIINNVETLANIPGIIALGADVYASIGTEGSKGTKVFALSGMVSRTGLVEIPMGTTLNDIVFNIGGGVPNGKKCKAVQIGGPSGGCIPAPHLGIKTDYEELKAFGAIMGSGGMVVMDESTCMVDLAKYFMEFIQSESCGKCIPCREGTRRMLEILRSITRSRKNEKGNSELLRFQGVVYLEKLAEVIRTTSLCGLGQTAPNPVLSTLRWFRDEYEAHIFERNCPAGACKELVGAPCQTSCPVDTEVWRYIAHVSRGELEEAYRVVRQANPFPSSCSRVCHHPCETTCRCGTTGGEAIAIRTLKRYIVDNVDAKMFKTSTKAPSKNSAKIAVIGAGPSGLTAAHILSSRGHKVTVLEKEDRAGGMLTCAIPEYRLPRETLNKEIANLLNDNVEIKYNKSLGKDFTISSLLGEGYKAVYVAIGSHKNKSLGLEGENCKGLFAGIDFLKAYNMRKENLAKGRVGIVGGGNSAVDAARVALRQEGVKEVTIFYRRSENEMPAYREEIDAALEEGIKIVPLVTPVKLSTDAGNLKGVTFIKNALGAPDASGRRSFSSVKGSEFDVELDTLIVAISEQPDSSVLDAVELTKWGSVTADAKTATTSIRGVFAGGDVVRGPNTVIEAIADGKRSAEMIDRYVQGRSLRMFDKVKLPTVYVEPVDSNEEDDAAPATRVKQPHLPLAKRKNNFNEVELCISHECAMQEAKRCLRCDLDFTQPEK